MELLLPLREREPPLPLLCRDGERDGERGRPLKLPFRESFSRDGLRLNDPLDFSRLRLRWLLPCLDNFPPLSLDGLRLLFWRESEPPLPLLPCRLKDRLPLSWDGLRVLFWRESELLFWRNIDPLLDLRDKPPNLFDIACPTLLLDILPRISLFANLRDILRENFRERLRATFGPSLVTGSHNSIMAAAHGPRNRTTMSTAPKVS